MRSEAQIRRVVRHLTEVIEGVPDSHVHGIHELVRDVLLWALGEKSRFAAAIAELDQVDRERLAHERAKRQ